MSVTETLNSISSIVWGPVMLSIVEDSYNLYHTVSSLNTATKYTTLCHRWKGNMNLQTIPHCVIDEQSYKLYHTVSSLKTATKYTTLCHCWKGNMNLQTIPHNVVTRVAVMLLHELL